MAILKNDTNGFRGAIDKLVVVRQMRTGQTVLSAYPDMSQVKPSEKQKKQRSRFAEAQKAAKEFFTDPANKASYQARCKPGQRAHGLFISDWLKKH